MQEPEEVQEALKQLTTAAPGALVEWCLKCGQIHVDKHVLSAGDTRCKEDHKPVRPQNASRHFERDELGSCVARPKHLHPAKSRLTREPSALHERMLVICQPRYGSTVIEVAA